MYCEDNLTQAEIGRRFGVSQMQAGRLLRAAGIPTRAKSDRLMLPGVTPRQHEVLVGSLLGDGSMSATGSKTARFSEGHSLKQEGYLAWKAAELGSLVSSTYKTRKVVGECEYRGVGLTTHGCRQLRPYYDLFYGTGKRVFPESLSDMMTPLVLAVWYMDDGSLMGKFHPRIAFGLDDGSLARSVSALAVLGLRATVHGTGGDRSIQFPGQSDTFFNLVRDAVGAVMPYKLPAASVRRGQDKNARNLTHEEAVRLRVEGRTVAEIALNYGVGRSTVTRRIEGGPKKMGRPASKVAN